MSLPKLLAVAAVLAAAPAFAAGSSPDDTTYPPTGAWTSISDPGDVVTEDATYPGPRAGHVSGPVAPVTVAPLLADDTAYPGSGSAPSRAPERRAVEVLAACGCGAPEAG